MDLGLDDTTHHLRLGRMPWNARGPLGSPSLLVSATQCPPLQPNRPHFAPALCPYRPGTHHDSL